MITDHVPAVRLPPDHAGVPVAAAIPARGGAEDRGDLDPAPAGRHPAAPSGAPPAAGRADRALLAALFGVLPRARRQRLWLLVTPDTIMRWHRGIARRRGAARSRRGRPGRPATRRNITAPVLRLARENPGWGCRRIHGELAGLGVKVAASTAGEILKASGIGPCRRGTGPAWSRFLRFSGRGDPGLRLVHGRPARWHPGLRARRDRARMPGASASAESPRIPPARRTAQQARHLIMDRGGQARRVKFVIRDRGPDFAAAFDAALADAQIKTVPGTVRTPRMKAIAERRIGGCRRELPDRTLVWNQHHLRRILREYQAHHNQHRPHRSRHGAAPPKPLPEPVDLERHRVRRHTRVGGQINEYRLLA
jgi:putative transposase